MALITAIAWKCPRARYDPLSSSRFLNWCFCLKVSVLVSHYVSFVQHYLNLVSLSKFIEFLQIKIHDWTFWCRQILINVFCCHEQKLLSCKIHYWVLIMIWYLKRLFPHNIKSNQFDWTNLLNLILFYPCWSHFLYGKPIKLEYRVSM